MPKTDFFEHEVLKLSVGQALTLVPPITPFLALFTAAPSDTGGGTEVTGGAYARVNAAGKFAAPANGQMANNAAISFPDATAAWGNVTHWALMTASTGGTMLRHGALTAPRNIVLGDPVSIGVGQVIFGED